MASTCSRMRFTRAMTAVYGPVLLFVSVFLAVLSAGCSERGSESAPAGSATPFTPPESVTVTADNPRPYRHPTTFPNSLEHDPDGMHADGVGKQRFRGKVVWKKAEGIYEAIAGARFYRLNDSMLLVEGLGSPKSRRDLKTSTDKDGAFDFEVSLFCAIGPNREGERIVFQTGAAMILVEAEGFQPLETIVCEQQPETTIVLSQSSR